MTEVVGGQTVSLLAQFYDHSGGTLVDLDATPTIGIVNVGSGATALAATTSGVTHPGTGSYGLAWTPSTSLAAGDYLATWTGTASGTPVTATETITVLAAAATSATNTSRRGIWYATREDVKRALDSAETARNNAQVDRAIEGASRAVESQMHRVFYPLTATRYFDWPARAHPTPWRLWFGEHDAISLTTVVAGGTTLPNSGWMLRPENTGPPFTHLEIDLSTSSAFAGGSTFQRAIAATGLWGYNVDEEAAGALAAAIASTSATTIDVTDSNAIGVGQIIRVDSERMLVTGKSALTTGQTLQTALTASNAGDQVAVTTGTAFAVGEVVTLDTERMLIVDVIGNNLTVKRAWDGTVLAAHTGSTIYAPRRLTVTRGALGTTAATHSNSTAIERYAAPGLIHDLTVAEALVRLGVETSGYVRTTIRGQAGKPISNELEDLRDQAYTAHGRKNRTAAV